MKRTEDASAALPAREAILTRARAEGFEAAGIAAARIGERDRRRLESFLASGQHGDMAWMARAWERRADPRRLWPDVRSILMVAQNYGPRGDPLALLDRPERAGISVYARGEDYHDTMKVRLRRLARWIADTYGAEVKLFVDTAAVMEKPLAQAAGLGWAGKHTNLVSRAFGSWLFLGEIFMDLDLAPTPAESDHCGTCRRCLDVCPTNAFPAPYQLDAARCISYLTIEHKGHIPREFRVPMGNRIYGCDDCLAVCPWNRFAKPTGHPEFFGRVELSAPRLKDLAEIDDASFRRVFAGSPIKRTGRDRFVRNVLIAIGNSGMKELAPSAEARLDDPSALVRAMAVWALSRLLPAADFARLRTQHLPDETDPVVREEWVVPPATEAGGGTSTPPPPSTRP